MRRRVGAQALVELALVLPLLLTLVFATAAVGRLVQVHMAVDGVAREAAREATLAPIPADPASDPKWAAEQAAAGAQARQMAINRGVDVARGYGLRGLNASDIQVDDAPFDRGAWVTVSVTYAVDQSDLPFVPFKVGPYTAHARQRVDKYRSRSL
ncbi:MAG: pilus assembly protein [Chloroflexi bacterium]|nr:pilus assembly protein [Chloroflexota bacterium]